MRSPIRWIFAASLLAACATTHPVHVDDARVARLPPAERQALIDEERPVQVAQSNLETMKVALGDAEQFRSIVESERSAAQSRLDAAQKAADLARKRAGNADGVAGAENEMSAARQRLDAANAKLQYAANLVALRQKQVEEREAELDLAQANAELGRYERLAAANQAGDLRRDDFIRSRDEAQRRAGSAKQAVDANRTTVQASQRQWNDMHQRLRAQAGGASDVTNEAPPPPQPID